MAKIVIVGGGTAGWMTAAYLTARLKSSVGDALQISLVESSDIAPIGVGEATTPTIRNTLAAIGISEQRFLKSCDATFKHGIKFVQWDKTPEEQLGDYYFHPFEQPLTAAGDDIAGHWLNNADPYQREYADAVSIQNKVSAHNLAPKKVGDPDYAGPMPYAYHLDAGKLAVLLKEVALERAVTHIVGNVSHAVNNHEGDIAHLTLEDGTEISADIFIDCSGFLALLIEKHYDEPFHDISDILFCDRAVACQVPYEDSNTEIRPYTTSTAQTAGWIWDIGLTTRRGTGHVYSSRHQSSDEAEAILRRYIGKQADELTFRHLKMRVGFREKQWRQNCIAIGLSGGFVEPLESTGIHLIEESLAILSQMIPRYLRSNKEQQERPRELFNSHMKNHYDLIVDFIKFHYYLSHRRDSKFWRDNTDPASAPADMLEKIDSWQSGYPAAYDFKLLHSTFNHSSYQYVMFGLRHRPQSEIPFGGMKRQQATKVFENVHAAIPRALSSLPGHRQYLEKIFAT